MIKVSSKLKFDSSFLKQIDRAASDALIQTAEALHTEVVQAQVVPRMDGTLQGEGFFVDDSNADAGKVSLVHSTPYARRLYFHPEYSFRHGPWRGPDGKSHEGNPNAKGLWFEDWLPGGSQSDFAQKVYAELFRRRMGL